MATKVHALGPGSCRYEFTEYHNQDGILSPGEFEEEPGSDDASHNLKSFNDVMRAWRWHIRGASVLLYSVLLLSLCIIAVGLYLLTWPLCLIGAVSFVIGNVVCCKVRSAAAGRLIRSLQEKAAELNNKASYNNVRFQIRHDKPRILFGWMRIRVRIVDLNAMRTTEIRVLGRASHVIPIDNTPNVERARLLVIRNEQKSSLSGLDKEHLGINGTGYGYERESFDHNVEYEDEGDFELTSSEEEWSDNESVDFDIDTQRTPYDVGEIQCSFGEEGICGPTLAHEA